MMGLRGARLGLLMPELTQMQMRAILEAACQCIKEGVEVHPEVMVPLTSHVNELKAHRDALAAVAKEVMEEQGITVD
jgi:pyruvate,orthophosphate dikinase